MAGIGGDGNGGDVSEGQAVTEGAGLVGGSGLGTAIGGDASLSGGAGFGGIGGGGGPGGIAVSPVTSQVSTVVPEPVNESPKVTENKQAVTRKARRRTLLGGEEAGLLQPAAGNIYRRSILGG